MPIRSSTSLEEIAAAEARLDVGVLMDAAGRDESREVYRWAFQSGVLGTRQYTANQPDLEERALDQNFAAISLHDHPDVRAISGLAELAAIINGQYVRVRHTDYRHEQVAAIPAPGGRAAYLARTLVEPPPVPPDVLAKPTGLNPDGTVDIVGDTQARWMREIPANPDRMRADLVFLEIWLEEVDSAGGSDAASSDRHSDIASSLLEVMELNTRLSATGMKDRLENLANRPIGTEVYDAGSGQVAGRQWMVAYRFNTVPIGNCGPITAAPPVPPMSTGPAPPNNHTHEFVAPLTQQQFDDLRNGVLTEVILQSTDGGHLHDYRITWVGSPTSGRLVGEDLNPNHQHSVLITQGFPGVVPFDEAKARDGVIDNTNRFRLIRDLDMMHQFNGDIGALADSRMARFEYADAEQAMELCWGLEGQGSVLYESYTFGGSTFYLNDPDDPTADANTPSLNSAKYNRRSVMIGQADAAGRQTVDRGFNDPQLFVATTTHPKVVNGVSWAIPMEVLIRTPLESWNPTGVPRLLSGIPATGAGSGTQADPWTLLDIAKWYFTPRNIWTSSLSNIDPADTATGTRWIRGTDGNAYEVTASGMWARDLNGTRLRWPCYRNAQEGSMEMVAQHVLRNRLFDTLAKVVAGTAKGTDLAWLGDTDAMGAKVAAVRKAGTTAQRPTGLTDADIGATFFDTSLTPPRLIVWTGTATGWRNADGSTI